MHKTSQKMAAISKVAIATSLLGGTWLLGSTALAESPYPPVPPPPADSPDSTPPLVSVNPETYPVQSETGGHQADEFDFASLGLVAIASLAAGSVVVVRARRRTS
jgi:hypothetical protein